MRENTETKVDEANGKLLNTKTGRYKESRREKMNT